MPNDSYNLYAVLKEKKVEITEITEWHWAYDVVASMFDFHCSDWGSNPGRGSKIS